MGDIQKLVIEGKSYVLLSEEDYEDLIDVARAESILGRIAAGEETWPLEFVRELTESDSRIRSFRAYRGMTATELAEQAGISQPYLSEIEAGKKTGSVDVLRRIAKALRVDLDDLVIDMEAERDAHQ
ncbi:helix-turn-helix transcriptional regulator [Rhizobium sp. NFR03]|uniref:helix-turn-helix domain-containing protein n=1 Tax=Rhizobium sp. NFR03 TaxID=1566263 RepID=UPI0008AE34A6|nr:helix-turn-helix transcriptional regulator [Rhizobium sp. NFR03]SER68846.1 DNA-binding transcriptional regulator, XRE-family HTH domain [Rhizobium sp. NFR03]